MAKEKKELPDYVVAIIDGSGTVVDPENEGDGSGDGMESEVSKTNNYFLSAAQKNRFATDKEHQKNLAGVVETEQKLRRDFVMESGSYIQKLKSVYNYWVGNQRDHYPKMRDILSTELARLQKEYDKVARIMDSMESNTSSMHKYQLGVLDMLIESNDTVNDANEQIKEKKKKLDQLNSVINKPGQFNYSDVLRARKAKCQIEYELAGHLEDKIVASYNHHLRNEQVGDLNGIMIFMRSMKTTAAIFNDFTKVLAEHIDNTKFIYDYIPEIVTSEIGIEASQNKIASYIVRYKGVLSSMLKFEESKLKKITGYNGCRELKD